MATACSADPLINLQFAFSNETQVTEFYNSFKTANEERYCFPLPTDDHFDDTVYIFKSFMVPKSVRLNRVYDFSFPNAAIEFNFIFYSSGTGGNVIGSVHGILYDISSATINLSAAIVTVLDNAASTDIYMFLLDSVLLCETHFVDEVGQLDYLLELLIAYLTKGAQLI